MSMDTLFDSIPTRLLSRLRRLHLAQPPPDPSDDDEAQGSTSSPTSHAYEPSPFDVVVTRVMLGRSMKLPPDLVDCIFDYAEYWAHSSSVVQDIGIVRQNGRDPNQLLLRSCPLGLTSITGRGSTQIAEELAYDCSEAKPLPLEREHEPQFFARLVDYPTPRLLHPCRKIVFTLRSHDQGWGGDQDARGTYRASWTWFEAGLERFDASQTCDNKCTYDVRSERPESTAPLLPVCALRPIVPKIEPTGSEPDSYRYSHKLLHQDELVIQRNKVATRETQEHVVEWSWRDKTDQDSAAARQLDEQGRGRATGDGTFVRELRLGDVVTVWGKARFPGWDNYAELVRIDVYWLV
ncbi:hypothetical protein CDD81_6465 [Ophiocordyceps australis]|uniref:Uncharacterized protein n=1 Tax=Ophiocordyceps australis TaxID=1399860 RepID=A0A2C5XLU7_9HYPO|nr:hypothetical protein CDD81_6465 [Ophiocordyceps australis]